MLFSARGCLLSLGALLIFSAKAQQPGTGWPTYGGDPGGTRYSASLQITRDTLPQLQPAWTFHTHALDSYKHDLSIDLSASAPSFETTPVLSLAGPPTLYFTSPYDVVFAIDAATGAERWRFDPQMPMQKPGGIITSRGVALWPLDPNPATTGICAQRVFVATLDARLLAIDAATGHACADFGTNGSVDLRPGIYFQNNGYFGVTSPPTVVGDTVVVGSAIGDNQQVDAESGAVRGFDARTGKLLWSWEPLPWAAQQRVRTGAGNTWSIIAADPQLGLVYLPTGSPSPDYYGGTRPGNNQDADSIVALDAATGRKVWAFQTTHHDVWDYDIASEPVLFTWRAHTPQETPAVAVTTKMGLIFLLDRRTGAPLLPVHERPVPQGGVRGEDLSPTQPFQDLPTVGSLDFGHIDPQQTGQRSTEDQAHCSEQLAKLRYDGLYTPATKQGSLMFPGNLGGVNWGGAALDPTTGILYANANRIAFRARLIRRWSLDNLWRLISDTVLDWANWGIAAGVVLALGFFFAWKRRRSWRPGWFWLGLTAALMLATIPIAHFAALQPVELAHFGYELSPQRKAPYLIERDIVRDLHGNPCTPPPWGVVAAINLNTGIKMWEKPLGADRSGQLTGARNFGGPIVTAGGLLFDAATREPVLRVYDALNGDLLRQLPLPAPGIATPMTYTLGGRQYVVIAAGGHGDNAANLGDSLIAFAVRP